MTTAIVAIIISFLSFIIATISCVIAVKNYKKSKRLEFFQRRDQLFNKISELNVKNSEARLLAARYEVVALENEALLLDPEYKERNKALVASIREVRNGVEEGTKGWNGLIETLHSMCSSITLNTDPEFIEKLMVRVQEMLTTVTQYNEGSLSALHILESTNPIFMPNIERLQKLIQQDKIELEKAMKELNEKAPD
jgi:hypothetical protein